MGILRTDKISGLEKTTAVTGSVSFDGTGDYLTIPINTEFEVGADFTFETWIYRTSLGSLNTIYSYLTAGTTLYGLSFILTTTGIGIYGYNDGDSGYDALLNINGVVSTNEWHHVAVVRSNSTWYYYIDGVLQGSGSMTSFSYTGTPTFYIGVQNDNYANAFTGYLSNYRVVKGKALYTSDFTPPVHALEPIDGTVLLCCNNPDSAGAASYAGIGTSKTITTNGNVSVASTVPGLTRDFTFGTQFEGVSKFDTQGYFVPPSGTTEQRGSGKAVFAGGYAPGQDAFIESVNINSMGNTTQFGTLKANTVPTSTSSATRQLVAGGYASPAVQDNIDFITIASSSNSVDFGTLGTARRDFAGLSNNTRSVFGGGTTTGSTNPTDNMEYVTSASLGSATPFGTLTASGRGNAACASPTRGIFFGGYQAFASPVSTYTNVINYITIATIGNGTDFGDLAIDNNGQKGGIAAFSNSTRGVVGGGAIYGPDAPAYTPYNTIEYVTIATTGNAQDFGDLTTANNYLSGTSNSVRGIFNQGSSPTYLNTIQYVTIASTGNAQDFGDAKNSSFTYNNAGSDSHGGIS